LSGLDDVLYRFEASVLAEETERREEATSARVAEVGEVLGMCPPVRNEVRDVLGVYARKAYHPPALRRRKP
jgi:hypothetical protein